MSKHLQILQAEIKRLEDSRIEMGSFGFKVDAETYRNGRISGLNFAIANVVEPMQKRIDELEAALKPFAEPSDFFNHLGSRSADPETSLFRFTGTSLQQHLNPIHRLKVKRFLSAYNALHSERPTTVANVTVTAKVKDRLMNEFGLSEDDFMDGTS